jgi:bla regulator protein blaR1
LKMLNDHHTATRRRVLAGAGMISVLLISALGLTASGTQAAERVRTKVETTIGVDLASIDVPVFPPIPALQEAPPAPPAPGAAPSPPASPAPPPPPVVEVDEKDGKKRVRVMVVDRHAKPGEPAEPGEHGPRHFFMFRDKDGKAIEHDFAELRHLDDMPELKARLRAIPEVSSRDCGESERSGFHFETREGDKRKIVICTNRIERHAEAAAARARAIDVIGIERNAIASALGSLRGARRSIEANPSLSDPQRAAALQGIDQAIREMESKRND